MGKRFLTTITLPKLPSPPSSPSIGDIYFDTTLGKIGVYTASGWVYNLYQIEDGSITTTKIADGAVTSTKLAPGAAVANIGYTPVNKAGDTMSGSLTVPSLLGSNNAILLISGQNYGVEIRIDEDSSGSDTFRITRGSGGSTTLMLVQNTGNVGIGTTSPTQRLDVSGNIRGTQFISTATTGTAPFQVNSTTKVNNLNADLLDGYDASTSSTANTVAIRDASGNLSASRFISTVSTGTAPLQVSSSTLVTNLNADLVDGYHASDFPRKSENATISGAWTFSATPSFGSGLRFTGGTSIWTSNGWIKVADLFKGQALVWRTGGGLSIGLGVASSSNTLYFSSSTADDNSTPARYPIVFDMQNGRIGIGTASPVEKIDIRSGNIRIDSSAVIKFGNKRTINVLVDQGGDTNTRYYYLGRVGLNAGILKVQGIMGGHTPTEGRANVDLQFSARNGFRVDGKVIGNIGRSDIYVYAPSGDSYIYIYLVTRTWALVNLELSAAGVATSIEFDETYTTTEPTFGGNTITPIFQLSTDTSNNILWVDSNRNVRASRFISTVSTGTAPLQVSSTTKVDNLNADLLDGYDSTDFPRKNENATITGSWTFNSTVSANSVTVSQNLVVAGNTIANSSGIPYGPLPALGNRGRDILVDRVVVWGDGMYPFALDLYKSDGWFTIPRMVYYTGQNILGSISARSGTTRVLRMYIVGVDNARGVYDPANQHWNNGRSTGVPWIRLIRESNTWNGPLVHTWGISPNVKVYIIELPASFLNHYFRVALGIWWDANSPSWPTQNISGDTVPDNYQNYGVDIQWTIYQVWFEIYDRY